MPSWWLLGYTRSKKLLKLSILYLRCPVLAAYGPYGRRFRPFNSLFEMPTTSPPRRLA